MTHSREAVLRGHEHAVRTVAFSPDARTLASGGYREIKLWEVAKGEPRATLSGHDGWVTSLGYSPDSSVLASASPDNTIRIWDGATGCARLTLDNHPREPTAISFSPEGAVLACANSDGTVVLWDHTSGTERAVLRGHSRSVSSVAYCPKGAVLVSASDDETIKLWDVTTGREKAALCQGHTGAVNSISFSPDGLSLASGSSDTTIKVWDVPTGTPKTIPMGHARGVNVVAFSPDGRTLASGSDDASIRLWDVTTGRNRVTLKGHSGPVCSVSFSPDGLRLASASSDGTVKLWRITTGRQVCSLRGHTLGALAVAFGPSARTLASAGRDCIVRFWDLEPGVERTTLMGHRAPIRDLAFGEEGSTLMCHGQDGTIRTWDLTTSRVMSMRRGSGYSSDGGGYLASESLRKPSSGGAAVTSALRGAVQLWDLASLRGQGGLRGCSRGITCLHIGAGCTAVATVGVDNIVEVWRLDRDAPASSEEASQLLGCRLDGFEIVPFPPWHQGWQDFHCVGNSGFAAATERKPPQRMRWGRHHPNRWLSRAQGGDATALYHLALIEERQRRGTDARALHLRAAAAKDSAQHEWAEASRQRLINIPWLRPWWPYYKHAMDCIRRGDFERGLEAYREMDGVTLEDRERIAADLSACLLEVADRSRAAPASRERAYRVLLKLTPNNVEAHFALSDILWCKGDLTGGTQVYRRVLDIEKDAHHCHHHLAYLLEAQGRLEEAVSHHRKGSALSPAEDRDWRTARRFARLLMRLGRHDEAIEVLEDRWRKKDGTEEILYDLVAALVRAGRRAEARERLGRSGSDTPRWLLLDLLWAESSGDRQKLGDALKALLRSEADYEEVENIVPYLLEVGFEPARALARTPQNAAASSLRIAVARGYALFAKRHARGHRGSMAREARKTALSLAPDAADVPGMVAWVFVELGDHENAARWFARVVELDPTNVPALRGLSQSLYRAGRSDEAMAAAQRVVALDHALVKEHELASAHTTMGLLYLLERDLPRAMGSFDKAARLKRRESAIVRLLDLLRRHPEIHEAHCALAFWYDEANDKVAARAHYAKYAKVLRDAEQARRSKERVPTADAR